MGAPARTVGTRIFLYYFPGANGFREAESLAFSTVQTRRFGMGRLGRGAVNYSAGGMLSLSDRARSERWRH